MHHAGEYEIILKLTIYQLIFLWVKLYPRKHFPGKQTEPSRKQYNYPQEKETKAINKKIWTAFPIK